MSPYLNIERGFASLAPMQRWGAMRSIMHQSAVLRPPHWRLPVVACRAVGGDPEEAIPAALAIACLHIGILLIDDLLDDDPRGHHHRLGPAAVANMAAAFQLAGAEAILQSRLKLQSKLRAAISLGRMAVSTAYGQHLDCEPRLAESHYWHVVRSKSGPFFGTALFLGALYGGASHDQARVLERFGRLYGEIVQIQDDLHDAMETPANPDWIMGRAPLPILFALVVDHPARDRFIELRANIQEGDNLSAAQEILVRCGAISYGVDQILKRHQAAVHILEAGGLAGSAVLAGFLERAMRSVRSLLASVN